MKKIIFLIGLLPLISCQTKKVSMYPPVTRPTIVNSDYTTDWEEKLADWLEKQPEDVRKQFVKDFFFSKDEIDQFVDTLKSKK